MFIRKVLFSCTLGLALMSNAALSVTLNSNNTQRIVNPDTGLTNQQGDIPSTLTPDEESLPAPFGANLFEGGFEAERFDGLNEDYLVAPGDKVSIWIWGAVNHADVTTVDNQGNIFIPEVGPVSLLNVPASEVNNVVTRRIRSVYTANVEVYVNLLTATPVSVFVTGPVERPGQYAGLAADSVLYYLKRAGGIDAERGSYRNITIMRDGEAVQQIDLYDFLRDGRLASFTFKDRDVVLVGQQGPTIVVEGGARFPYRFELTDDSSHGETLTAYARPLSKVSHVGLIGTRDDGPMSVYLPFKSFLDYELRDGDRVVYNDDLRAQVLDIKISGSYLGPSYYAVNKSARLLELLDYIEVDPELADTQSVYIKRVSVAERQKEQLEESLRRLERATFTAPASSDGEALIRAKEAELVTLFVERARQVEPLGKVVLSSNGNVANIRLEQGDEIVIPTKSDLIQIAGEVLMPQAVVYNPKATVSDYVAWAGGFTERADVKRIGVVKANGSVSFGESQTIEPGDQILIMPRIDAKTMQAVKDITQIIYQIAVAANVVLD